MKVLTVRNANEAFVEAMRLLGRVGVERESRDGPVLAAPYPVTTWYERPRERVLLWTERDANPFLHFFEGLWMLAGRNDVAWLRRYAPQLERYSDDGVTMHGAYGERWRHWPCHEITYREGGDFLVVMDQLEEVAAALRAEPDCRRQVLTMWDPARDLLGQVAKRDLPCNTHAYVSLSAQGGLDLTVCCRSNDVVWGAYGSDVVHFSMLQEVLAAMVGVPVGSYWQVSNNWHGYRRNVDALLPLGAYARDAVTGHLGGRGCAYEDGAVQPFPMVTGRWEAWFEDLSMFMDHGLRANLRDPFFRRVVVPMARAHEAYKEGGEYLQRLQAAQDEATQILAKDWQLAVTTFLSNRWGAYMKRKRSEDGEERKG